MLQLIIIDKYPGKEKSGMGYYVNPSAESFAAIVRSGIYVDKSGLIAYMNKVVQTDRMLVCSSRPRRFGKSFAAKMLAAYYSRGADARAIFQNLKIAKETSCENLNQYDVIFLDITLFLSIADTPETVVKEIQKDVIEELKKEFPGTIQRETESLLKALMQVHTATGRKFFIIIDEWDALFREAKQNTEIQKEYIQLLRSLFKNNITPQIIAGAYMTGILPIKKYGTQSALTDFREYTMLEPGPLAPFVGFTEDEVKRLCEIHPLDFEQAKRWYDGYVFEQSGHIYSPNSIIEAIQNQNFANYWTQTETYESLMTYMDLNFDGLKDSVIDMIGGMRCKVDVGSFQNDMTSLKSKDDVLTLFVHLGYLAYDRKTKEVFIPNEEIREEFIRSVKNGNRRENQEGIIMKNIILASQSPRRRELLTQIGLEFEVHPAGGEEIITSTDPVEVVKSLSAQKAGAVKEEMQAQLPENWLVIGADTIVVYDGKILGKPKDEADAIRMLTMLQGQTHSVYTGVTLLEEGKQTIFAEETKVTMYPMTEEEIRWYVDTKEPMDKAGAYGIQGLCARFVEKIQGDYNNVVGLPVGRIYQELKKEESI